MTAPFKDWRGTPITIGSTVVYPSRQSTLMWMNEGVVVSVDTDIRLARDWERGRKNFVRIGVTRKGGKRISYPDAERVTVIS